MNYTTQAQEVLKLAAESAKLMQHPYIGTEHLLIGLSKIYSGVAGQVLDMNGVKEEDMLKIMNELVIWRYRASRWRVRDCSLS